MYILGEGLMGRISVRVWMREMWELELGAEGERILGMGEEEFEGLCAWDEDGGVRLWDVGGGYLLGKEGLRRLRGVRRAKGGKKNGD